LRHPAPAPRPDDPRTGGLRTLGYLLDEAIPIPGTGRRIGFDALIGLVPGVGDGISGVMSAYIVVQAARMGVPVPVLARMILNLGVDGVVGTVPLLGDLFDAGWKANTRNLALLRTELERPGAARRSSALVVAGTALAALAVLAGFGFLAFLVARAVWGALAGLF
jgi:hypothetical protein